MELDPAYRISVLEREVARLTLLVEKLVAEKLDPSVIEREVARLVEKLIAEKSNPPSPGVDSPNSEERDIHRVVTFSHQSAVIHDQSTIAVGEQRVNVPRNVVAYTRTSQVKGPPCDSVHNNSFEETLKHLTGGGDAQLEVIVEKLREQKYFDALRGWHPFTDIIKNNRGRIISWIIHPVNIRKFKNRGTILTMRKTSLLGDMFSEIFEKEFSKGEGNKFKNVFWGTLAKVSTPLPKFISGVVEVHQEYY